MTKLQKKFLTVDWLHPTLTRLFSQVCILKYYIFIKTLVYNSIFYLVKSSEINRDMAEMDDFWDFSTLPNDHPLFNKSLENQLGYSKIETGGDAIISAIGNFNQWRKWR